jgi:ribosomal protein S18 acetylase RimI-like enzyme
VFTLRKYRPQDFHRLVEIDQACFVEGIAYDEEEMRNYLSMPSGITLVGAIDGEIQGFIIADRIATPSRETLGPRPRRGSRFMGRIITIDVAPRNQHAGLGTLLLTAAEDELQRAACDYVLLEVAVDNESALSFYKKHDYSVLKVLPRYYLDSIDGLLMGKKL